VTEKLCIIIHNLSWKIYFWTGADEHHHVGFPGGRSRRNSCIYRKR